MRILAIDYGKKRVGIAVSDPLQIIAQPLVTIENKDIFEFLKNYIPSNNVVEIIIGYPFQISDKENIFLTDIDRFINKIQKTFPNLKIIKWDEHYTSILAQKALVDGGFKKKDRQNKQNIDKIAAAIILQEYLNNKNKK